MLRKPGPATSTSLMPSDSRSWPATRSAKARGLVPGLLASQLERDVGGVVAVTLLPRSLHRDLGRHAVGQRDRTIGHEGRQRVDDGLGELLRIHPPSLSAGHPCDRTGFTPWPSATTRVLRCDAHPTYDQLIDLPAYVEQPVPMPFEDINGHLNVRHYIGIASEGLDESLVEVGIPQMWPLTHGQACFTAEHHVTYLHELRTGDTMSARVRLLGRSERAGHALVYLLDHTHQQVACVVEEIFLHIDLESRRTAPWPADIAEAHGRPGRRARGAGLRGGDLRLAVPALTPPSGRAVSGPRRPTGSLQRAPAPAGAGLRSSGDRALVSGTRCRRFESCRRRTIRRLLSSPAVPRRSGPRAPGAGPGRRRGTPRSRRRRSRCGPGSRTW